MLELLQISISLVPSLCYSHFQLVYLLKSEEPQSCEQKTMEVTTKIKGSFLSYDDLTYSE